MVTDTWTVTEIIWSLLGCVGLIVSVWNLVYALESYKFVDYLVQKREVINGEMCLIARWHVVMQAGFVVMCLAILGCGIAAGQTPPAAPHNPVSNVQIIVTVLVFIIALTIVAISVGSAVTNQILLREHSNGGEDPPSISGL